MSLSLFACGGGGDDDDDDDDDDFTEQPLNEAGEHHEYVVSQLLLPTNQNESSQYGFNLDYDETGRVNNALGAILSTLASMGDFEVQPAVDEQIAMGGIILLTDLQTIDLTTSPCIEAGCPGLWVYLGDNPSKDPCDDVDDMVCGNHLDGDTSFDIHSESPTDALLTGPILGGTFTGGPGTVTIQISLIEGSDPITLDLIGAQAEIGEVSADGLMTAKLGGAIPSEQLQSDVYPTIVDLMNTTTAEDCTGESTGDCPDGPDCNPCGCTDDSSQIIIDIFDTDDAESLCEITLEEFNNNSFIATLLGPDVDLRDDTGAFNPGVDGVDDALSLGIGFQAVPGTINR